MEEEEYLPPMVTADSTFVMMPIGVLASGASDRALRTYMAIKSYLRSGHGTFPKISTVGEKFGLSESYMRRGISELKAAGFLRVTARHGSNGGRLSNIYHFPTVMDGDFTLDEGVADLTPPPSKSDRNPPVTSDSPPLADLTYLKEVDELEVDDVKEERPNPDGPDDDNPSQQDFIIGSLCKRLAERVAQNTGMKEKPVGKRWLDSCRRMITIDGLDPTEMWHVLEWSQNDEFWQGNIQSMDTFRRQYGKLVIARRGKARQPVNKIREALDSVDREMNAQVQAPALAALDWKLPIGELD